MKFLDQAKIYIKAGNGGSGSAHFRREKFVEFKYGSSVLIFCHLIHQKTLK